MNTTLVVLVALTGTALALLLVWFIWKKVRAKREGGGLDSPLLRDGKDHKKEAKKNKDPVVQLLYGQVQELQAQKMRMDPEHSRLMQQDLVNRKIFEQLNNQQKHINEVINSQDKILREQMSKIDVIERQEECMIDKIDEFMRETIQETAKEIHNEAEYHHYRHRKLQQTLLQQTAERTAGLLDTEAIEKQLTDLKGMFQRTQDDRQKIVSTLSALQTQGQHRSYDIGSGPVTQSGSSGPREPEPQPTQQQLPPSPASTASPTTRPPINISSLTHPLAPQPINTFPYPYVSSGGEGKVRPHGSPRATEVAASLSVFDPQASTVVASRVPPALRKKRAAEREKEREGVMYGDEDTGGGDWWKGLMASNAGPLRPEGTFSGKQEEAEKSVTRVEYAVLGESRQDTHEEEVMLKPQRSASYVSSRRPSHTFNQSLPSFTASQTMSDMGSSSDDDDLAHTAPVTGFKVQPLDV